MHRLRTAQNLARLVLVWFVLAIGAAVASPMVNPQAMELVCTSSGAIKLLVQSGDGVKEMSSHTLDCPLCLTTGTPPPTARTTAEPPQPLSHALLPLRAAHIAWLTAAPPPARGPPSFS